MLSAQDIFKFISSKHPVTSTHKAIRPTTATWVYVNEGVQETNFRLQPDYAAQHGWTIRNETRFATLMRLIDQPIEGSYFVWTDKRGFDLRDLQPSTSEALLICEPSKLPKVLNIEAFRALVDLGKDRFKFARDVANLLLKVEVEAFNETREDKLMALSKKLGWTTEQAMAVPSGDQYVWRSVQTYFKDDANA